MGCSLPWHSSHLRPCANFSTPQTRARRNPLLVLWSRSRLQPFRADKGLVRCVQKLEGRSRRSVIDCVRVHDVQAHCCRWRPSCAGGCSFVCRWLPTPWAGRPVASAENCKELADADLIFGCSIWFLTPPLQTRSSSPTRCAFPVAYRVWISIAVARISSPARVRSTKTRSCWERSRTQFWWVQLLAMVELLCGGYDVLK